MELLIFFATSADKLLVHIPFSLKHVLQVSMSLPSIHNVPIDTSPGSSNEYTQVHFQYLYIVISPDSYIPLKDP